MPKTTKTPTGQAPNNSINVTKGPDESDHSATARAILGPDFRHAYTASQLLKAPFGNMEGAPGCGDYAEAIHAKGDAAVKGDLAFASRMLAAQAMTLDTIFAEMARRMACNMGGHLKATDLYGRIALKAQANSRATLETLAKLHQPREQSVRHVHVNEGAQAVIADQFHHHGGRATGDPALPSPDALGEDASLPASREAAPREAMPARR